MICTIRSGRFSVPIGTGFLNIQSEHTRKHIKVSDKGGIDQRRNQPCCPEGDADDTLNYTPNIKF